MLPFVLSLPLWPCDLLVFICFLCLESYGREGVNVHLIVACGSSGPKFWYVQSGPKPNCYCQNFVKSSQNLIIFGRQIAKTINLCEVHSLSISSNLCQRTTVWNANGPPCIGRVKWNGMNLIKHIDTYHLLPVVTGYLTRCFVAKKLLYQIV